MTPFRYESLPGRIVFGAGSARTELAGELDRLGARRVLLITTERALPLARELAEPLGGLVTGTFTGVREHVPAPVADAARTAAADADCLLAIGGGSTVGTAKAVASEGGRRIVAVPTTYAGSEMTPVWGITEAGVKRTARSVDVLPSVVVYDPELTTSLPAGITATSGMNAMAHCVEAVYAGGANPISTLLAADGARALAAGLPRAVADGSDVDGRADVLYGAYLAGAAFAAAGGGLHHALCHLLGGRYRLPHADTHTVLLPYVADLVEAGAPELLAPIATALGTARVADGLRDLVARLGAPSTLRSIGMADEDVAEAAALAVDAVPAHTPVDVDEDVLLALLTAAQTGERL